MDIVYTNTENDFDKELVSAAAQGDLKLIQQLIDLGANINNQKHWTLATPLHAAVDGKKLKAVMFLLEKNANTELLDNNDLTPLLNACSTGGSIGSGIAMALIKKGANINYTRESDGMTALKFAVGNCRPEVIEELVKRGVDVDGPPGTDQTALMLAARRGDVEALSILLKHGADPNYPCGLPWAKGKTALWHAVNEKRKKTIAFLNGHPTVKKEI